MFVSYFYNVWAFIIFEIIRYHPKITMKNKYWVYLCFYPLSTWNLRNREMRMWMKALLGWRDHPGQGSLLLASQPAQKSRRTIVHFLEEWRAQYANQTQVTERCVTTEAQVRDITKKISSLVQPMYYYPLLVFQVSSDEVPTVRL